MASKAPKDKTAKAVSVPAGIRWSPEEAQKALAKRAFIRVGGKNATQRYISGALRSWNSEDPEEKSTIFNIQYRITGTPQKVTEALSHAGLSAAQITAAIKESITAENVKTVEYARLYAEEHEALEALRKAAAPAEPETTFSLAQLITLGSNVRDSVIVRQVAKPSTPSAAGTRGPSLKDRLEGLASDKVLDVSNMDRETGKSVRTVNRPKSSRGGKYLSEHLPLVSNNLDNFVAAVRLAQKSDSVRQTAISAAEKFFSQDAKQRKQRSKAAASAEPAPQPRVPSPPRQKSPQVVCPVPRIASPVSTRGGVMLPNLAALRR